MNLEVLLADAVGVTHAIYIAFIAIGFALILAGIVMRWEWVRGLWFRLAHMLAILLVCAESLGGMACPLTKLESHLRALGGETGYAGDFVGYWIDRLIYYDLPAWMFGLAYIAFGLLVVATFVIAPPGRPRLACSPCGARDTEALTQWRQS